MDGLDGVAMTPRITRNYYTRVPRWSTDYPRPFNWLLVRPLDVLPLAVSAFSGWFVPLMVLSIIWFCWRFARRLWRQRHWCDEHGHDPYRPVPEVAEYRCRRCDSVLPDVHATGMAATVEEAAAEVGRARLGDVPQARWSDRR